MADPELERQVLRMVDAGQSYRSIYHATGIARSTIRRWDKKRNQHPEPVAAPVPEDDMDPAELFDHLVKRSRKIKARWDAERWRRISIATDEPFAITWFTDVHLGDPGTNYARLRDDIELTRETPYAYAAFMGDASNNWPVNGRLGKKWADQETSKRQEHDLVEWFLKDSGLTWLFWVLGNHDVWGDGETILRMMNADLIPMHDWRAQFILACGNGREVKLDVSHNFKGHSQWNTLHAEGKEAQMGEGAHFYFSGHLHTAALHYEEYARRGITSWLMRAKGYKEADEYAHRGHFPDQDGGHAGVTVIDPQTDRSNPIVFATLDVEEGMDYLRFKRS